MHSAAYEWVAQHACPGRVLDIGGLDINGSVRGLFGDDYTSIDVVDGPGVDVVADVCDYQSEPFDVIVCCEVLEHTDADILGAAYRLLRKGGTLLLTAAGPGRPAHSAIDGGPLRGGEYYRNIEPGELATALASFPLSYVSVDGNDVRAVAIK